MDPPRPGARAIAAAVVVFAALAAAGCGDAGGEGDAGGDGGHVVATAEATIGAEGGRVEIAGLAFVEIPAGALDGPSRVVVEAVEVEPAPAPAEIERVGDLEFRLRIGGPTTPSDA
jgi:hypothetical protein